MDFAFVDDEKLRGLLVDYYAQAQAALKADSYLGAMTACGAVREGLLTWRLLRRENEAKKASRAPRWKNGVPALDEWSLKSLIEVARELELIGDTAEAACWAVKDFRNLVHPYGALRRGSARPNKDLAQGAYSAVHEVVRSIQGRLTK